MTTHILAKNLNSTKRGATSMFIVIFMVLILTVMAAGFARLMLSEAARTTNNDLSQSAYDSALAGIEDAKVALLKYHECLSEGFVGNNAALTGCQKLIWTMQEGIRQQDCDTVKKVLGRDEDTQKGTIIQETQSTSNGGVAEEMVQAYTCVTIEEELADYRTTIGTDSRVRIIPIRSDQVQNLKTVEINWFSSVNAGSNPISIPSSSTLGNLSSVINQPPLIAVSLFQANKTFSLSQLSTSKDASHTNRGTLYLKPSTSGSSVAAADLALSADKNLNEVIQVSCSASTDFYCHADIPIPNAWNDGDKNEGASFLLVTLPYGSPETDLSIKLRDGSGSVQRFSGVQARVDSTGRANDLYRRVEVRVELVDTYFPYPEFTIQMQDSNTSVINKTFYTTGNCWNAIDGKKQDYECKDFVEDLTFSKTSL